MITFLGVLLRHPYLAILHLTTACQQDTLHNIQLPPVMFTIDYLIVRKCLDMV